MDRFELAEGICVISFRHSILMLPVSIRLIPLDSVVQERDSGAYGQGDGQGHWLSMGLQ